MFDWFSKNYNEEQLKDVWCLVRNYKEACKELDVEPTVEGLLNTVGNALEAKIQK